MSPDDPVTREQAFVILNDSLKVGSDPAAGSGYVLKLTAAGGAQEVPVVTQAFQL